MYAMVVVLVWFRDETRAHFPCATVTTQAVMYGMVWYHCTILQKFADFSEEEVNGHSPIF